MPRGVVALGLVSLFTDMSSELVHSLLPLFLVGVLGASMLSVGLIEGIAEGTAAVTKVFSGWWSDRVGRRKPLTLLGYGLATLTKPLFPLADSIAWVLAARFFDRIGKGIRSAPRDALIADITPAELRGSAYGLRQTLDATGAVLGPLLAVILMLIFDDIRTVLWFAVIPAIIAVAILGFAVHEPARVGETDRRPDHATGARPPVRFADAGRLTFAYWWVVGIGAALTLARFSEAFLLLRAEATGLATAYVPMAMIVMSGGFALSAYPAGRLADRIERRGLLAAGFLVLIAADLVLAFASGVAAVMAGALLWGLHMGLTQSLLSALVADAAPADLRGTAFGLFNLVTGVMLLVSSAIAGLLWDLIGPSATFLAGAAFTAVALASLIGVGRHARVGALP
ncbi:MAG: MFS transporter [Alphaproteobacteria bacterium]|nr:MFS transporter [Alphaproteobacteria bacterium]